MTMLYHVRCGHDAANHPCFRFDGREGTTVLTPFIRELVEAELLDARRQIEKLVHTAAAGAGRGCVDIASNSARLRQLVFGEASLSAHAPFRRSVLLDVDGYCATIAWELVNDDFVACTAPEHRWVRSLGPHGEHPVRCPAGHSVVVCCGPLGVHRHLGLRHEDWHLPRRRRFHPGGTAKKVLILGDPQDNLDAEQHLCLLDHILSMGFSVELDRGGFASRRNLLRALEDPDVAAVYVFAHGAHPGNGLPARIVLHDNEVICAKNLPPYLPGQPFVFLNCCWSAEEEWSQTAGATDSLAGAFLRRGASAVVGALCRVTARQAARAAGRFFQEAMLASTLGHALARVRSESYRRYLEGEADLSWFAYRFYGNPQRCLATPVRNTDGTHRQGALPTLAGAPPRRGSASRKAPPEPLLSAGNVQRAAEHCSRGGIPAIVTETAPHLVRVLFSWILRSARETFRPVQQVPPPLPGPGREGLGARTGEEIRRTWAKLIQEHEQWVMQCVSGEPEQRVPLPAGSCLADYQSPVGSMTSPGTGSGYQETQEQALGLLRRFFATQYAVPEGLTTGAVYTVHLIWQNALISGASADLRHVALAAFLEHPLIGTPYALYGEGHAVEYVRERLLSLEEGQGQGGAAGDVTAFVGDLLARARSLVGTQRWVDETALFLALCERYGWLASLGE